LYLWGDPIEIAADLDEAGLECARRVVETRMVEMVRDADSRVGNRLSRPRAATGASRPARPVAGE
jgi:hypothetical protein